MRLMQIHKPRNGYKPVSPQPFDFSRYAGRQSKLLMRTDVKRREIWEWSDHTPCGGSLRAHGARYQGIEALYMYESLVV
jgi:hypothetical protein